MLLALALIPVVVLLIIIYFCDKKEKEPIGLLIGLFFAGAATIITAIIIEAIGELILTLFLRSVPAIMKTIFALFVVGPAEELGKYLVLWLITWKNKHFDYSYDAIVYAVFVSLGFACFENINYVFSNGFGTAILRMFTAVPGHACFAVFMGFFYAKAKYSKLTNEKGKFALFTALSMIVPIIVHGLYDAIIMFGGATGNNFLAGASLLLWIGFVILMFGAAISVVVFSSKRDFCIIELPKGEQVVYKPAVEGLWTCSCGKQCRLNFCTECGKPRPIGNRWVCPNCGNLAAMNFCGKCGKPRAVLNSPNQVTNPV